MQKLMLSIGVTVVVCGALFAWSHNGVSAVQASPAFTINTTGMMQMMQTPKSQLPIEQCDAI